MFWATTCDGITLTALCVLFGSAEEAGVQVISCAGRGSVPCTYDCGPLLGMTRDGGRVGWAHLGLVPKSYLMAPGFWEPLPQLGRAGHLNLGNLPPSLSTHLGSMVRSWLVMERAGSNNLFNLDTDRANEISGWRFRFCWLCNVPPLRADGTMRSAGTGRYRPFQCRWTVYGPENSGSDPVLNLLRDCLHQLRVCASRVTS